MPASIHVHLLPTLCEPEDLKGGVAVIIDVLRASTTMIQALASGASGIAPCESVEEARTLAAQYAPGTALLGGERRGQLIPGFDLDNSPRAYTRERMAGQTLIFTTTNGTRALRRARLADRIVVAAFVNLTAVTELLRTESRPVHVLCAGTDARLTAEDILCGGMLAARLAAAGPVVNPPQGACDLGAELAIGFAQQHGGTSEEILRTLRASLGGRNLLELGHDADIDFAAQLDVLPVVPEWDWETDRLRIAR